MLEPMLLPGFVWTCIDVYRALRVTLREYKLEVQSKSGFFVQLISQPRRQKETINPIIFNVISINKTMFIQT